MSATARIAVGELANEPVDSAIGYESLPSPYSTWPSNLRWRRMWSSRADPLRRYCALTLRTCWDGLGGGATGGEKKVCMYRQVVWPGDEAWAGLFMARNSLPCRNQNAAYVWCDLQSTGHARSQHRLTWRRGMQGGRPFPSEKRVKLAETRPSHSDVRFGFVNEFVSASRLTLELLRIVEEDNNLGGVEQKIWCRLLRLHNRLLVCLKRVRVLVGHSRFLRSRAVISVVELPDCRGTRVLLKVSDHKPPRTLTPANPNLREP